LPEIVRPGHGAAARAQLPHAVVAGVISGLQRRNLGPGRSPYFHDDRPHGRQWHRPIGV